MAELAWIGVNITEISVAIIAVLACDSGAKESNGLCQVTYFNNSATGWHGGLVYAL